jgi:hypothetical protein
MFKKFSILFSAILVIAACKKETKTEGPSITITSPVNGTMYNNGDSVLVAFTITDPDMHSYDYLLINTSIDDTFASIDETHVHDNVIFSQKFLMPSSSQITLEVNAEDHSENATTKSVSFHTM